MRSVGFLVSDLNGTGYELWSTSRRTKINGNRVKKVLVPSVYISSCALNIHAKATTHTMEAKMVATRKMRIAGWLSWKMCREIFMVYSVSVCV